MFDHAMLTAKNNYEAAMQLSGEETQKVEQLIADTRTRQTKVNASFLTAEAALHEDIRANKGPVQKPPTEQQQEQGGPAYSKARLPCRSN